jgi:NAD(P)-dependent dehydrogenase (short-subunit alcohol dehydrogenase family)
MADASVLGLSGKRVLVTGAASGMGEATARILGELGAEVLTLDVKQPSVANTGYFEVDLRDPAAIEQVADAVTAGGPVERLFNCAGIAQVFPPVDVMLVNFLGMRHLTETLLPKMPNGAAIANISSGAAMGYQQNQETCMELLAITDHAEAKAWCEANPVKIREGYSFSKECIILWTMMRSMPLAEERQIRINCIAPGPTDTGMMPAIVQDVGQDFMDKFPKPLLGRNATPEEQAYPLIFLNSDMASIVSGVVLWTDQAFAGGLFTGQIDFSKLLAVVET